MGSKRSSSSNGAAPIRGRERPIRILLAEDDAALRHLLAMVLRGEGYEVVECKHGLDFALKYVNHVDVDEPVDVDLVISDIRMPGVTGLEILEDLQATSTDVPVILMTAFGDDETHRQARELGAAAVFDKPFELDGFVDVVRSIVELTRLRSGRVGEASG